MTPQELSTSMICPNCGQSINTMGHITPGHSQQVRKGLIVCCMNCCMASMVGDYGLAAITPEKFRELDTRTQNALKITLDGLRQMKGGAFGATQAN